MSTENEKRERRFAAWWCDEGWRCCDSQDSDYDNYRAACHTAWMNGADVQKHSAEDKDDAKHLEWIYGRLVERYGENPNVDFMRRFEKILEMLNDKEQG